MTKETYSLRELVQNYVGKLGVSKKETKFYYKEIYRVLACIGVIDFDTLDSKRKKPYKNSPVGKFVNYDENGKHIDSFVLSDKGKKFVIGVLETLTDKVIQNKHKSTCLPSLEIHLKVAQREMEEGFLIEYLRENGVEFDKQAAYDKQRKRRTFFFRGKRYMYFANLDDKKNPEFINRVININDTKKDNNNIFWFIYYNETQPLMDGKSKVKVQHKIYQSYWNWKCGNGFSLYDGELIKTEDNKETSNSNQNSELMNLVQKLMSEVQVLKGKVRQLEAINRKYGEILETKQENHTLPSKVDKEEMINAIKEFTTQKPQKRYKTINQETIAKEKDIKRKKVMEDAYKQLDERRLLTAKYRPDEWKFAYDKEHDSGSIELLYRLDKHNSTVYNTRHRLVYPYIDKEGKKRKEECNKGEKYNIPYGIEKLDYNLPYIFITEGVYDSCFVKNCLAYSTYILPSEMDKTIQLFRNKGYQVIHILDNFRFDDEKGGQQALTTILKKKIWLQQGDRIFDWSIYSDCKDLNEVAMKYQLDEIPYQTIVDNSWNEEKARDKGIEFICMSID